MASRRLDQFDGAITYIREFLVYGNEQLAKRIVYASQEEIRILSKEKTGMLFIVASDFFFGVPHGKEPLSFGKSLKEYRGIPIFFGTSRQEKEDGNFIIYADYIAAVFYFLSRYEEYIAPDIRDEYGNYPAEESTLFRYGLLDMPILDQYSRCVLDIFGELDGRDYDFPVGLNKVYFTHDIDVPFNRYTFAGLAKTIGKSLFRKHRIVVSPFLNWMGFYCVNPRATWNYMLEREWEVKNKSSVPVESICFIISLKKPDQYSMAYIDDRKIREYLKDMSRLATIGLHTSYLGAETKKQLLMEKHDLENTFGKKVIYQRNHYLRQINPMDIRRYEEAGFSEDFTIGFNETPGFRLGTSRSVKWIDPMEGKVHDIVLHSLHIMDGSLSGKKPYQLGLDFEEAKEYCKRIMDRVVLYHGDLCLLWHNGMFDKEPENYQKELYDWVIGYCKKLLVGGNG